jgi:hypothetical protein
MVLILQIKKHGLNSVKQHISDYLHATTTMSKLDTKGKH